MTFHIRQIEYHRNGVSGLPFHAVLFQDKGDEFLASVFAEEGAVSIVCLDLIPNDGVTFGRNSWRGDVYEARLRAAIAEKEAAS